MSSAFAGMESDDTSLKGPDSGFEIAFHTIAVTKPSVQLFLYAKGKAVHSAFFVLPPGVDHIMIDVPKGVSVSCLEGGTPIESGHSSTPSSFAGQAGRNSGAPTVAASAAPSALGGGKGSKSVKGKAATKGARTSTKGDEDKKARKKNRDANGNVTKVLFGPSFLTDDQIRLNELVKGKPASDAIFQKPEVKDFLLWKKRMIADSITNNWTTFPGEDNLLLPPAQRPAFIKKYFSGRAQGAARQRRRTLKGDGADARPPTSSSSAGKGTGTPRVPVPTGHDGDTDTDIPEHKEVPPSVVVPPPPAQAKAPAPPPDASSSEDEIPTGEERGAVMQYNVESVHEALLIKDHIKPSSVVVVGNHQIAVQAAPFTTVQFLLPEGHSTKGFRTSHKIALANGSEVQLMRT